uniref:AT11443p n=1 Tax=Drosophila melanogaster TaxID=7227 RepID=Q8MZD3_DROME|nr:AT11443p [Drosophila melanogaster]
MSSVPVKSWGIQFREVVNSPYVMIALTCVLGYVAYMNTRRQRGTYDDEDYENEGHRKLPTPLTGLHLNRKQLAKYNSAHPDKIYLVALHEVIFDVSSAEHIFGPGGEHEKLTGTEISDFIKKQAIFLMRDTNSNFEEWKMILEDFFYPAGTLIDFEKKNLTTDVVDKMDSIVEESSEGDDKSGHEEQKMEPEREPANELDSKLEVLIPEIPELHLGTADDPINSDCDSLRTAYDFPPGHDDRADEKEDEDDDENKGDVDDEETWDEVGQGDRSASASPRKNESITDGTLNDTIWNDTDVTMIASV